MYHWFQCIEFQHVSETLESTTWKKTLRYHEGVARGKTTLKTYIDKDGENKYIGVRKKIVMIGDYIDVYFQHAINF